MPPVVKAVAPAPTMTKPLPAYIPGRPLAALPQPQVVHAEVPPALMHPVNQPHPPAMQPGHMPPPDQHQVNQSQPRPSVANPETQTPHEAQHPPVGKSAMGNEGASKPAQKSGESKKSKKSESHPQKKDEGKKTDEHGMHIVFVIAHHHRATAIKY